MSCSSASVGFCPRERITVPSSLVVIVPSPSLSNRENASLNSAICSTRVCSQGREEKEGETLREFNLHGQEMHFPSKKASENRLTLSQLIRHLAACEMCLSVFLSGWLVG